MIYKANQDFHKILVALCLLLPISCSEDSLDFRRDQTQVVPNGEDLTPRLPPIEQLPPMISLLDSINEECGIDLNGVMLSQESSKELFKIRTSVPLMTGGNIKELVDVIVKEPTLAGFVDFILNITRFFTGIQKYTASADVDVGIEADLSGTKIGFVAKINQLNIDLLEKNPFITKKITELGNQLTASILSRQVTSHFVSIGDRILGKYGPEIANTICTLQFSDSMSVLSETPSTVSFNPPIPTAINPFAQEYIYQDQVPDTLIFESTMTLKDTKVKGYAAGQKFPIAVKIEQIDEDSVSYCGELDGGTLMIFRFSMISEVANLFKDLGIFQQLDFFVKRGDGGDIYFAIGAESGIDIIKQPICIKI